MSKNVDTLNEYLPLVKNETVLMGKLLYKLNNQMGHFKSFQQTREIEKLLNRFLKDFETWSVLDLIKMEAMSDKLLTIIQKIEYLGLQMMALLDKGYHLQFASMTMAMLSRIHVCLKGVYSILEEFIIQKKSAVVKPVQAATKMKQTTTTATTTVIKKTVIEKQEVPVAQEKEKEKESVPKKVEIPPKPEEIQSNMQEEVPIKQQQEIPPKQPEEIPEKLQEEIPSKQPEEIPVAVVQEVITQEVVVEEMVVEETQNINQEARHVIDVAPVHELPAAMVIETVKIVEEQKIVKEINLGDRPGDEVAIQIADIKINVPFVSSQRKRKRLQEVKFPVPEKEEAKITEEIKENEPKPEEQKLEEEKPVVQEARPTSYRDIQQDLLEALDQPKTAMSIEEPQQQVEEEIVVVEETEAVQVDFVEPEPESEPERPERVRRNSPAKRRAVISKASKSKKVLGPLKKFRKLNKQFKKLQKSRQDPIGEEIAENAENAENDEHAEWE